MWMKRVPPEKRVKALLSSIRWLNLPSPDLKEFYRLASNLADIARKLVPLAKWSSLIAFIRPASGTCGLTAQLAGTNNKEPQKSLCEDLFRFAIRRNATAKAIRRVYIEVPCDFVEVQPMKDYKENPFSFSILDNPFFDLA
jgi:hypothetical protein